MKSIILLAFLELVSSKTLSNENQKQYPIRKYGLSSFQAGGTKLERFLHKNQHTQRKLFNFELWINGELSKIGYQ